MVIGKGGETIDKIIEETGVKIDIDEEGNVQIYSPDQDAIDRAKEIIANLVREAKIGEVYPEAEVVRIESFGAFVNLFDKTDALVHISELAWERTNRVEDVVKLGDKVAVKVLKIDDKGRVNASIKALLAKPEGYKEQEQSHHSHKGSHKPGSHSKSDKHHTSHKQFQPKSQQDHQGQHRSDGHHSQQDKHEPDKDPGHQEYSKHQGHFDGQEHSIHKTGSEQRKGHKQSAPSDRANESQELASPVEEEVKEETQHE